MGGEEATLDERPVRCERHTPSLDSKLRCPDCWIEALSAEAASLREALEDLTDRQLDYPTDLSTDPEWRRAFSRARAVLDRTEQERPA